MRLALITPGGLGRTMERHTFPYLAALVERLARAHDVHVFALHQEPAPSRYHAFGATVHNGGAHGPARKRAYRRTLSALIAEHRRAPFDLLHAFWLVPSGLIALISRLVIRRPLVVHAAGGELVAMPDIGYGWRITARGRLWVRLALFGATRVSAASAPMIDSLKRLGVRAERIPFGVDLHRWQPLAPRPRLPGSPARLLHVGDLNRVKDQGTLIRAAAIMRDRKLDFHLDIAGHDTLNGAMHGLVHELGLEDRVRLPGFLSRPALRSLAEAAHVLLVSSRHEAGPFAMLEAAVAGVPTVGTAVGHVAEWAPGAAVAVRVGDPDALARATAHLLEDDERRLQLAYAAHRRALTEDADWTANRVEDLYRDMTS